jgi:NADPH-dependent 2,4-dienoyl-CoA reductase/sulfur reductase-like enzyme
VRRSRATGGDLERVVVVGGSVAALRSVQGLRRGGFSGRLTVVSAEPHLPYNRPPLSKAVLTGEAEPESTSLAKPEDIQALELDLRLREVATGLDLEERWVHVGAQRIPFDGLVISTGASPRRLPTLKGLDGVHVLRTLEDAVALRAEFARRPRVLVVGCGFIGSEVASSARACGLEVTVVDVSPTPLAYAIGPEMGAMMASLHSDHGTELRLGTTVAGLEGDGRVARARLTDGDVVEADLVVVGVGVTPNTAWLEGSGLELANGVVCDASLNAGPPGVYAAGDVARWRNDLFGHDVRVEHWTTAGDQGAHVARNLLAGKPQPFVDAGYIWSDQYGVKLQVVGLTSDADEVRIVHGDVESRKLVAWYRRGERLVGAFGISSPPLVMQARRLIEQRATWSAALQTLAS